MRKVKDTNYDHSFAKAKLGSAYDDSFAKAKLLGGKT
jgi:hypothetical protein